MMVPTRIGEPRLSRLAIAAGVIVTVVAAALMAWAQVTDARWWVDVAVPFFVMFLGASVAAMASIIRAISLDRPGLPVHLNVHPWFLADAIRWYANHPEHRAAIGTDAEHDRLVGALTGI